MKTIVIASQNPVKIRATLNGFQRMFPAEDFRVQTEALQGALNRAKNAARGAPGDYWVGIEGGVTEAMGEMTAFAWIAIRSNGQVGKSRTGTFFLPGEVAELVRSGKELGEADDIVFGRNNSKQENGAIGILTGDVVDRTALYEQAVILALVPFKNLELYRGDTGKD